jgi:type I restriction enzyme S subunit
MVALQEEMIEELKAYKQSVITEAVTKGLNPNVPMKDSGIDCIGLIPAHWHQCRLRNIGGAQNGISKGAEYFGEGFPFVSYGDVYRNYSLPYEVQGRVRTTAEEQEHYSVEAGDIFFTRTSETIDEVGFSCVCEKSIPMATYAGFVIRVRPYSNVLYTGYAKYYFRSSHHRSYLAKEMNLVTRASLGQDLLKSMPVLVPPKEEQKAIASFLDKKCDEIDRIISQKEGLINKLIDYKKSMIYEIVTGKKEVP